MLPIPVAAVLEPAPSDVSALPACAAADLSVSFDREGGAFDGMSQSGASMVVRNVGPAPCRVPARPSLAFAGPDGTILPIRFRPPPGMHPGPVVLPVGIAPGAAATAGLLWVSGDAFPGGRCYATATVRVSFGEAVASAPLAARMCGPAQGPARYDQRWLTADPRPRP